MRQILTTEPTRYEITASDGSRTFCVGYTARTSRHGLLRAMQGRADAILARLGVTDTDQIAFACKPRVHAKLSGWIVGFSGRTQREAAGNEWPDIAQES